MRLSVTAGVLLATLTTAQACPQGYVCVPRDVVNRMSREDVEAAKQLARNFGVTYKIIENTKQKRRGVIGR